MARLQSEAIHGHEFEDQYGSHIPPVYLSVVYEYVDYELGLAKFTDRGNYLRYGREENPTTRALERVVAKLERGEDALAFNSGMAAEAAVFLWGLDRDTRVVVPAELYSSTFKLLEELSAKIGFKVVKVWPSAEAVAEAASGSGKTLVFTEVFTNPTNKVIDLEYLRGSLDPERATLVVDNTFTTPVVLKPLKYGARLVLHSATKYLAGHNDVVGGVVAGSRSDVLALWDWRRMLGSILQPFEAFLTLRGLKTLEVRFQRVSESALKVAEFLAEHPRVEQVMYPGLSSDPYHSVARRILEKPLFGGVVSFKVRGSYSDTLNFVRRLKLVKRAPSLGGAESLVTIPVAAGSMFVDPEYREKLGITKNLVRLSVGLEDPDDIIEDLSNALG